MTWNNPGTHAPRWNGCDRPHLGIMGPNSVRIRQSAWFHIPVSTALRDSGIRLHKEDGAGWGGEHGERESADLTCPPPLPALSLANFSICMYLYNACEECVLTCLERWFWFWFSGLSPNIPADLYWRAAVISGTAPSAKSQNLKNKIKKKSNYVDQSWQFIILYNTIHDRHKNEPKHQQKN